MTYLHCRCEDQLSPGYYADPETQCQVFHICVAYQDQRLRQFSFLCPNGTVFSQQYLVCVWWYDFDCSLAISYYDANAEIFAEFPAPASSSLQRGTSVPAVEEFSRTVANDSQGTKPNAIDGGSEATRRHSVLGTEQQPGFLNLESGISVDRASETQDSLDEVASPSDLARVRPQESTASTTLGNTGTQRQDEGSFGPGDIQSSLQPAQSQREFSSMIDQGLSHDQGEVYTTGASDALDKEGGFTLGVSDNHDRQVTDKVDQIQELKNFQDDQTYEGQDSKEDGFDSGQRLFETDLEQRQIENEPIPNEGGLIMIQIQDETDFDDGEKLYAFPQRQEDTISELELTTEKDQFDSTHEQGLDVIQDQRTFDITHEQTGQDFIHNQEATNTSQVQTGLGISHNQESFDTSRGQKTMDIIQSLGSFDTNQRQMELELGFSQNQGRLDTSQGHKGFDFKQGQEFVPVQKQEGQESFDSPQKRQQFESSQGHNKHNINQGQQDTKTLKESRSPLVQSEGQQALIQDEHFPQRESSFDTTQGHEFDSVQGQSRFDSMQEQKRVDAQGKEYEYRQGSLGLRSGRGENVDSGNVEVQDFSRGQAKSEFLREQIQFDPGVILTQEQTGFTDIQQEELFDSVQEQRGFDSTEEQMGFDLVQERVKLNSLQEQVTTFSNLGQGRFDSLQFQGYDYSPKLPGFDSTQKQEETGPVQGFEDSQSQQGFSRFQGQTGFDDNQNQEDSDFSQGRVEITDTSGSIQGEDRYNYTLGQTLFNVTQSQGRFDTTQNQAEFDLSQGQDGFDVTEARNQATYDVTQSQEGFGATQSQTNFDVTQSKEEYDTAHSQEGFDTIQNQIGFGVTKTEIRLESSEEQSGIADISNQSGFGPNRGPEEDDHTQGQLGLVDTHSQVGFNTIMGQVGDGGFQSHTGSDTFQEQLESKATENQAETEGKGQLSLGVSLLEQANIGSSQRQNGLGFTQTQQRFDSIQGLEPSQEKYKSNEMQEVFPFLRGEEGNVFSQESIILNQEQGGQAYNPEKDVGLRVKDQNNLFQGSPDHSENQFNLREKLNDYSQEAQTYHASLDQSGTSPVGGVDLQDDRLKLLLSGVNENKTEASGSQFGLSKTHSQAQETHGPISGLPKLSIPPGSTVNIIPDISLTWQEDTSQSITDETREEQQQNRKAYNYSVSNESLFTQTGALGSSSQSDILNDQNNLKSEINAEAHGLLNEVERPQSEALSINTQSEASPQDFPISVPQDITSTNIGDPITAGIQGIVIEGHLDTISSGLQDTSACIHDATSSLRNTKTGILISSSPNDDTSTIGVNTQLTPEELFITGEDGNAIRKTGSGIGQIQDQESFTEGQEQIKSQEQLLLLQGQTYSSQGQVFSGQVQTHHQEQSQGGQKFIQSQGQPFQSQEQLPTQEKMNSLGQFTVRKEQTSSHGQYALGQEQDNSNKGPFVSNQEEIHGSERQISSNDEQLTINQVQIQIDPEKRQQTFISQGQIFTDQEEREVNIGEFIVRKGQMGETGALGIQEQLVKKQGDSDQGQFLLSNRQTTQPQNYPRQFAISHEQSKQAHSMQKQFVNEQMESEHTFISQEQKLSVQGQLNQSKKNGLASPQQTSVFSVNLNNSQQEPEGYRYSIPINKTSDSSQSSPVLVQEGKTGTQGTSSTLSTTHSIDNISVQGHSPQGMKLHVPEPSFTPIQQVTGDSGLLTSGDGNSLTPDSGSNILHEFPFPLDFIPPTNEYIPPRNYDSDINAQELLVSDGSATGVLSLPETKTFTSPVLSQTDTQLTTQQQQQSEFGLQQQQQPLINNMQQQNIPTPVDLEALLLGYLPPSKDSLTYVESSDPSNVSSSTTTSGFLGSPEDFSLTDTAHSAFINSSRTSSSGGSSFFPSSGESNFFSTSSGTTKPNDSSGFFIAPSQPHSGIEPTGLNGQSSTSISDPHSQPVYPGAPARQSSVLSLSSSAGVSSSTLAMPSNAMVSQKLLTSIGDFSTNNGAPRDVVLPLEQHYRSPVTSADIPRNTRHTENIKANKIYVTPLPQETPRHSRTIMQSTSSKPFRPSAQVLPVMNPQEFIPKTRPISHGKILFPQRSKTDRVTSFQRSVQVRSPLSNPLNQYEVSMEPAARKQTQFKYL